MVCSVYKITNNITGKSYIGVSVNPQVRFRHHCNAKTLIGKSLRKHGVKNFSIVTLLISTEEYCYQLEPKIIESFKTRIPNGYNVSYGGDKGRLAIGEKQNPETIKKISEARKGKKRQPFSEEWKEKLRINIKHVSSLRTPESFAKMVETKKKSGKQLPPISEETREKLRAASTGRVPWNKGKKWPPEMIQRLKYSSPKKRKPHSEETKRKIGEKSKGRYFSPEVRKKMSESRKAYLSKKRTEK